MQYELYDNQDYYHSLTHEDWCDLLSKIEVKDDRKRAATQIKKIASSRVASLSDRNRSVNILSKNKARLGDSVLCSNKGPNSKAPKHHGIQRHCVICKKAGMPEKNYMLNSSEEFLASVPTRRPSRIDWGDLWEVGLKL